MTDKEWLIIRLRELEAERDAAVKRAEEAEGELRIYGPQLDQLQGSSTAIENQNERLAADLAAARAEINKLRHDGRRRALNYLEPQSWPGNLPSCGELSCDECNARFLAARAEVERLTKDCGELNSIRELCARRPALDKTTLLDNVGHAIKIAAKSDSLERELAESRAEAQTKENLIDHGIESYRELEARLTEVTAQRDEYKGRWCAATGRPEPAPSTAAEEPQTTSTLACPACARYMVSNEVPVCKGCGAVYAAPSRPNAGEDLSGLAYIRKAIDSVMCIHHSECCDAGAVLEARWWVSGEGGSAAVWAGIMEELNAIEQVKK